MADIKTMSNKVAAPRQLDALGVYSRRWDLFPHLMVVMVLLTIVSIFHVWSRAKVIDLNLPVCGVERPVQRGAAGKEPPQTGSCVIEDSGAH